MSIVTEVVLEDKEFKHLVLEYIKDQHVICNTHRIQYITNAGGYWIISLFDEEMGEKYERR